MVSPPALQALGSPPPRPDPVFPAGDKSSEKRLGLCPQKRTDRAQLYPGTDTQPIRCFTNPAGSLGGGITHPLRPLLALGADRKVTW